MLVNVLLDGGPRELLTVSGALGKVAPGVEGAQSGSRSDVGSDGWPPNSENSGFKLLGSGSSPFGSHDLRKIFIIASVRNVLAFARSILRSIQLL
jgi:hypothetical protein